MPRRNRWKIGDYLMRDDESGKIHYASEMIRRWDGHYVRMDQYETRQPQEFVRARKDPTALTEVRPDQSFVKACDYTPFVGATTTETITGPASHLFEVDGIGEMEIGCSFIVHSEPV